MARACLLELATRGGLADDGTKARDEQNLELSDVFHGFSLPG